MTDHEKLLVKCEEEPGTHPHCPHGPMLCFHKKSSPQGGYFACSAFRDKKACGHPIHCKELTQALLEKRYPVETYDYKKARRKMKSVPGKYRNFCHTCNQPYVQLEAKDHLEHDTLEANDDGAFANPTSFLKPIENDKVEAQYFFDEKSLEFFLSCLENSGIRKLVCIGAPRLHAFLAARSTIRSFLLDFDHRYFYFYDDDQFSWYNMCNNHFFEEKQRLAFEAFLKTNDDEHLGIFTDPPFGCRTEVIANSIKQITNLHRAMNARLSVPATFWVYPYFCELYISQAMPEMQMCDYKVNYTNHESYGVGLKGRKLGSPVRLFTNVPLHMISLPSNEGYKFCKPCNRWTAIENVHCPVCKVCPSKNGDTYRHCRPCRTCVKPNYFHCQTCERCAQKEDHNCTEYRQRVCRQIGHNEHKYPAPPRHGRTTTSTFKKRNKK